MSFQSLIEQYGYVALFGGTFLEGESFIVAAGFAAHRGYLSLPIVCAVATLGSFSGDQFWYYLGRRHGAAMIAKRPDWDRHAARVRPWVGRHRNLVIVGSRFAYGFRVVTPVLLGSLGVPPGAFALWNAVGSLIWAVTFGVLGYFFGQAVQFALKEAERYEVPILGAILALGATFVLVHVIRSRRAAARDAAARDEHGSRDP
ncbi:MAG: DedA family protein [Phycisphaerales bacterium]